MPIYRHSFHGGGNGDFSDFSDLFRAKNDKQAVKIAIDALKTFIQAGGTVTDETLERGRAKVIIMKKLGKFVPTKTIQLKR